MPYPWSANDILTAADLNAAFATLIVSTGLGAYATYTPTWSGTLGNGTIVGRYVKIGRFIAYNITLTWGTTTTHGAGAQTFSLPTTSASSSTTGGTARCTDSSSGTNFTRHVLYGSTTTVAPVAEAGVFITGTVPMTWGVNDVCGIQGFYESTT